MEYTADTYYIIRKYQDNTHPDHNMIVDTGLSLEEAQKHCSDPATHETDVWFDCYYNEGVKIIKAGYTIPASKICGLFKRDGDILHRINYPLDF
jgi:hypothetical protein